MKEIDSNKHAWSQIAKDHYESFGKSLANGTHHLNHYITKEVGDLSGKSVIHLQCNTGADTILLAGMAQHAVGVDLVPDNIHYAKKLAEDLNIANVDFIESDIMELMEKRTEKYAVMPPRLRAAWKLISGCTRFPMSSIPLPPPGCMLNILTNTKKTFSTPAA